LKNNLNTNLFTVRPKYFRLSPLPPCHVIDKLQEELSKKSHIEGWSQGNVAILKFPESKANFWSPELDIHVNKRGKGSTIRFIIGPNQKVRSFFILLSGLAVILFFLGLLMAIYQWMFNLESPLTWSIPTGLLILVFTFVLVKIGLYKSKDQMKQLWYFCEQAIDEREKKQRDLLEKLFPGEEIIF